jgi:competence protein ComEC
LILLLLDPFLVSAVGFQLSVTATAGMVAFAGPLAARLRFLSAPVAASVGTSVAAQLGVAPLLLSYFHWIPGVTVLANLLAFPVVGPVLLLGLAAAALASLAPPLAALLAGLAHGLLTYMMWLADNMARAPVASVTSPGGLAPLVVGSAIVVALAVWIRSEWRPPRAAMVAGLVAMPVFVLGTALGSGPPSGLTARFLDIGQGDSILVTSPSGATVLIDGGPEPDVAATKLAALGVKRLDVVIASHPHADHVAGLPEVLARFPVGLVLEPGCAEDSPAYEDFLQAVRDEGLDVRHPRAGDFIDVGDVNLEFLSPPGCYEGTHSDANNDSLVAMLSIGEDTILLPGDAEVEAQQEMLDAGIPLDADVLKVPHHAGDTSLPEFLAASHAEVAVIQVGQPNDYGHPTEEVLAALEAAGMRVFRNDMDGDVTVTFSEQGVLVESATS